MQHMFSTTENRFIRTNAMSGSGGIIIIIIMKEFIVRLLQCGHEQRCITLSIKLNSVVK